MGNQQGKQGAKRAAQTYPFDEPEKKSRTDWTAGKKPSTSSLLPIEGAAVVCQQSVKMMLANSPYSDSDESRSSGSSGVSGVSKICCI